MRDAETVLAIIRERGKRGLPLEDIYRLLYNPDLFLRAYARLYPNKGALTPGATTETADGMSLAKIEQIIDELRHERYRWTPVRRTYIPKRNGKLRRLGISTWRDKLLQEVMRSILDAYYEPQFSELSHGFRPGRGCHTALQRIKTAWTGVRWFVEADISQYFDTIDNEVLVAILREKLYDNRFLRLIHQLLQAGYLEDWRWHTTLSGVPQGSGVSPILANLYLDKLDQYVETVLIPKYTRGAARARNGAYLHVCQQIATAKRRGERQTVKQLRKLQQRLPSADTRDPDYRRLHYLRYADDVLLGFAGPRHEAEEIKHHLKEFLLTLKLQLSDEKTLITQASTTPARFLGYEIVNQQVDDKHDHRGQRSVNGRIGLRVPKAVVEDKCSRYMERGKPTNRPELLHDDDFSIVTRYQAEYRGIVQFYALAVNVSWFWKLHWVMKSSLLKTLANKHKTKTGAIVQQYQATVQTSDGAMLKCLEVQIKRDGGRPPLTARFGGLSLKRQRWATLIDQVPLPKGSGRTEILKRLLANECELCGSQLEVQVHHIRKLADLKARGRRERPAWAQRMAARQRKTLVVCQECHKAIHAGRPTRQRSG